MTKTFLRTGALLMLLLAVAQIFGMFVIYQSLSCGVESRALFAQWGHSVPFLFSVLVVVGFSAASGYAFSASGDLPRLPHMKLVLTIISVLLFLRFLWGLANILAVFTVGEFLLTLISLLLLGCFAHALRRVRYEE